MNRRGHLAHRDIASSRDLEPDAIEVWKLDTSSYDSVSKFAESATRDIGHFDIALLNTGVYHTTESFDKDTGYGESAQINCLSAILLVVLPLPAMKAKQSRIQHGPGRIAIVWSGATR
ncbi:hypothetical protein F5B19DRAFT_497643 [Rostrohypoxylon terebratum]|nr:hypothetical protein F5B19DRAFT_497643 [Rostrohypoxylon terebratum]